MMSSPAVCRRRREQLKSGLMPYKIHHAHPLADEISRIGLEQIDRTCRSLGGRKDPDTDVHEARKGLKRLRSLLRLIRPLLGCDLYRAENARLRDISRGLAGLRDVHVMATTIERLRQSPGGATAGAKRALTELGKRLDASAAQGTSVDRAEAAACAQADLESTRQFWSRPLPTSALDERDARDALLSGLAKTYGRIRSALDAARQNDDDDRYHDARKAVQHHGRHMTLLSEAWPDYFVARSRAARSLAQILGDHHDLAVLRAFGATAAETMGLTATHNAVIERLCRADQRRLCLEAEPIASRLLAASPRALVREVAATLASCRATADAAA